MAVRQEGLMREIAPSRSLARARPRVRQLGVTVALGGWIGLALIWATGSSEVFGHEQAGTPSVEAIGRFLFGWLIMVAGMMLPSSLPTFVRLDRLLPPGHAGRFMAGYFMAWVAFGAAAFVADGMLHQVTDLLPWFDDRPSLVIGGMAVFAGSAEMVGRPPPPLVPGVPTGAGSTAVGRAHAVDRIRRCWPLMLFAMGVGMGSALWMVSLTLAMMLEQRPGARSSLRLIGLGLVSLGVAAVIEPAWVPVLFGAAPQA